MPVSMHRVKSLFSFDIVSDSFISFGDDFRRLLRTSIAGAPRLTNSAESISAGFGCSTAD